jgi:hypothetical protein
MSNAVDGITVAETKAGLGGVDCAAEKSGKRKTHANAATNRFMFVPSK